MTLDLPYPHKALWPNGRAHYMTKARQTAKHRDWALQLTKPPMMEPCDAPLHKISIRIRVHGKARGPVPDADNVVAAAKAYLDGIAARMGVNDRNFAAPTVEYCEPRNSRFVIDIGEVAL
jgi:crossover junction endodeoxyribonuclease RusA